jgi:hypothetical protein
MKTNKLAMGLSLTILVALWGGGIAHAKGAATSPANPMSAGDPVQTQNPHNKGLKSPHSARKEAAKRLRPAYQQEHQQKLQNWAKAHHGYTGQGQAGHSLGSNQKPASNRGVK